MKGRNQDKTKEGDKMIHGKWGREVREQVNEKNSSGGREMLFCMQGGEETDCGLGCEGRIRRELKNILYITK